jgi:hypothetical protein
LVRFAGAGELDSAEAFGCGPRAPGGRWGSRPNPWHPARLRLTEIASRHTVRPPSGPPRRSRGRGARRHAGPCKEAGRGSGDGRRDGPGKEAKA